MIVVETSRGAVQIRELRGIAEMLEAESIQRRVWGAEVCPHPKEILIPVQHEGGLLAGAFAPDGTMIGLVFAFPTRDPAVQHSQLLATLEEWRGLGIGARLKWFQRDWCLERGICRVRWTVDPLRAVNAALNILHLGAVCSTYFPDYYGVMQGIDAGAPTDRLLVEWPLLDKRVAERAARRPADEGFAGVPYANALDGERPLIVQPQPASDRVLIRIPENFIQLSKISPDLALAWRAQTRALFQDYFGRGFEITGFTWVGGPAYLLEQGRSDGG